MPRNAATFMTPVSGTPLAEAREHVSIPTLSGDTLDAWLYLPATAPRGVLVMAMGIGGVKAAGTLPPFAEHFQARGFASVIFDYRYWGDSEGSPRHLLRVDHQLQDYRTVLRWASRHDELGRAPLFAWGTSFGGLHAVAAAASEPGLTGAIAQCPLVDGLATARGGLDLRRGTRLTAYALADLVRFRLGRRPVYVPLGAAPGGFGLLSTRDAQDGFDVMLPGDWPNEVTARSLLDIPRHRPVLRAADIRCPILIVVQEQDSVAPVEAAVRVVARAPRGELFRGRGGHYDLYAGRRDHEDVLQVETEFLLRAARHANSNAGPGKFLLTTRQ
jgi:dienelactone hydrolase